MNDFQLLLKELRNAFTLKLPFVSYRKPHEKYIKTIVQQNQELFYVTDSEEPGFVFAPFNAEKKTILIPLTNSKCVEARFVESPIDQNKKPIPLANSIDRSKHFDLVNSAISFINSGQAKKVVVSRKETFEVSDFSFIETFQRLLHNYNNAFVYVWYHPSIGLWMGATPELLITLQGELFKTVSLAGTQPYSNTHEVFWGPKELEEQQMVTDYIESKLKPLTSELSISEVETVQAGNVLHLRTEIQGSLKNKEDKEEVIKLIHPTPAVCGLPKESAKQFIKDNEDYDREFYTGYLGEMNIENSTNLYVNLRCMKYEASDVSLFLGGGITKDSNTKNEWNETVEKSKVIKNVL